MTGRITPSSQRCQSPSVRIDSVRPFFGNVSSKEAVIVRMGRSRLGQSFGGSVADEKFLARNAQAFAAIFRVDFRGMSFKPRPVALEAFVLRLGLRQLFRVGDLSH